MDELATLGANSDPERLPIGVALSELHFRDRRSLLSSFLDAAGIPHTSGELEIGEHGEFLNSQERVVEAVDALAGKFSADDVAIYLLTLIAQDSHRWAALDTWRRDGAIQLATAPVVPGFPLTGAPADPAPPLNALDERQDPSECPENEASTCENGEMQPPTSVNEHTKDLEVETDLAARLRSLRTDFDCLAAALKDAADELAAGRLPDEKLADQVAVARVAFESLKTAVIASLVEPPTDDGVPDSLASLSILLENDGLARARALREAALEPARGVLLSARRLIGLPSTSALEVVWREAERLLAALDAPEQVSAATRDEVQSVCSGSHALAAVVTLAGDEEASLSSDQITELGGLVKEAFGESVARAAMRSKLSFSPDPPPIPAAAGHNARIGSSKELIVEFEAPTALSEAVADGEAPAKTPTSAEFSDSSTGVREHANDQTGENDSEGAAVARTKDSAKERDETVERVHTGEHALPSSHENSAWRELGGNEPALAYFHALLSEDDGGSALPSTLVRAVCLSPFMKDAVSAVGERIAADLATLDLSHVLAVNSDELQQALRLLVVAGSLRSCLLDPASVAAMQLDSLRHDAGFAKLWEFCRELVDFSRGGSGLNAEILSLVSTQAAWADRVSAIQNEARAWLLHKAPAYRFKFPGATKVWRKMLEKGNLIDSIVRPSTDNNLTELTKVQNQIDGLSSIDEIHHRIQRIDREEVGRSRGADLYAGALRELETSVLEGIDLARRWVQIHRVNPSGREGWRLEQANRLRATLVRLRPSVLDELREAHDRSSRGRYMPAAATRCTRAVEDLCGLFEQERDERLGDRSPDELLAMPLLLRPDAPIAPGGTVNLAQREMLEEALSEQTSSDLPTRWNAAFDNRLARQDFIGVQLLLDRADQLGYQIDDRERGRLIERKDKALIARRDSLRFEIVTAHRSIAEGAAKGFLREEEHNALLADVTQVEVSLDTAIDFPALETTLRAVQVRLSSFRQAAVKEVRELLAASGVSDTISQKVGSLLDEGDVLTATEVLQHRDEWVNADRIDEGRSTSFVHFLRFLRRVEQEQSSNASVDIAELPAIAGAPDSPENLTPDSRTLLGSWIDRRQNQFDVGLPKRLFGLIGFNVENVDQPIGTGFRWQSVTTTPVRDRERCPVPLFGSRANGHYEVLWVWAPTSPEDIVTAVVNRDGSRDEAVIVLYFGSLTENQRRTLRFESLQKRTRFLVVDEILVSYLARLDGARMSAFFACSLPFTNLVPYHTLAGEVPPEMFYGRHRQRHDIQERDGTCLVYGGRQLGKTALLRDVQREFTNKLEGRIAIYADLKAAGIGVHRDADAVWGVVANELRHAGIPLPESDGKRSIANHEVVEKAVANWLAKAPGKNRVLVLLDEADLFFKSDGEDKNFANAHLFKALMDRTQRSFKVVFAGLHNVQRSTRIANHPLAHMGVPVCVGPMVEGLEWQAAVALVERPLATMGYEISRDLTIRILSHTNYYPSLIQIYCTELLRHVSLGINRYAAAHGALPAKITPGQVEDAYRSSELRQRIKQSFDLTLNLDPRYKVIALCVANETPAREPGMHTPKDIGVGELRTAVMSAWGDGFRHDRSEDGFRSLLEEMVGLGVLRRSGENRYALRGANIPLLLGSEEEVFLKLELLEPPETYETFEPDTYRRPLSDTGLGRRVSGRAALTTGQEFELYAASNGVAVITGVAAAGLRAVTRCLETAESVGKGTTVKLISDEASEETFANELRETIRKGALGTTLLVVPDSVAWNERWIHTANESLRSRTSKDRFIRATFIAGPEHTWSLFRDHGGNEQTLESLRTIGVMIQSLRPWRAAVVRHWLEEQQLSTANPAFHLKAVEDRTGYWPLVLAEYVDASRRGTRGQQVADPGPDFIATLLSNQDGGRWMTDFGLSIREPAQILRTLSRLSLELGPVRLDELVGFGEVEQNLAEHALAWADSLGLVRPVATRRDGPVAWAIEQTVDRIIQSSASLSFSPSAGRPERRSGARV